LFRNDPSSRYLWSLLWGQQKSAAEAYWPRRLGGSPGWWLRGWVGCSSSSSSSSARCRLRRHRRPPGPTLSYTIPFQYLYTTHLQKPNLSSFCCMNTPFIPSFSCISSRTELPSSSRSFYLSIYLSIIISSSGFFAFLLWVFDPRSSICILVQVSVVVVGACVCVICCKFEIIRGIREGFEQLSRAL
jgi:hypothetical protein